MGKPSWERKEIKGRVTFFTTTKLNFECNLEFLQICEGSSQPKFAPNAEFILLKLSPSAWGERVNF